MLNFISIERYVLDCINSSNNKHTSALTILHQFSNSISNSTSDLVHTLNLRVNPENAILHLFSKSTAATEDPGSGDQSIYSFMCKHVVSNQDYPAVHAHTSSVTIPFRIINEK